MNERFAAEPSACDTHVELKYLLEKFGPATGRYLAEYPDGGWERQLRAHIESWGQEQRTRALTLLRRARERWSLVRSPGCPYEHSSTWLANVEKVQSTPRRFDQVVVSRANAGNFASLDELDLPPTAAEPVLARAAHYVRSSRTLLVTAPELHFIDPYLDPCDASRVCVLQEMLREAATGNCEGAFVWVSAGRLKRSICESVACLRQAAVKSGFKSPRRITLRTFTDAARSFKVHDRYLLCLSGAIRFEHGFQELTGRRTARVSPEGPPSHSNLVETFMEDQHDMDIEDFSVDA